MSINFDVNEKAKKSLGTEQLKTNTIMAAFNGRAGSPVEACGAVHDKVIGNFPEPSAADMMERYKNDTDPLTMRLKRTIPRSNSFSHPFVEAAHLAFSDHYPLVVTPDTVWLCIAQGFANHINVNAEALRKRFVAHEGKKLILLERDSFIKGSPDNDWRGCFSEFSDKLAGYIGKKRDLVVSNFSTTGDIERAASEVVLMDSMKSYFKYGVRTLCGIPNITLTGTVQDWEDIFVRAENLSEYDLEWWTSSLAPVLDKLVATAEGKPDVKFWDSFYKKDGGSGGPYSSGWINTLFPYLQDYKGNLVKNPYAEKWEHQGRLGHGPTLGEFPHGLSKVPFKWQYYTTTYDMEFLAGMVGIHQDEKTLALTPSIGWAVRDQGTSKEGPIDGKEDW